VYRLRVIVVSSYGVKINCRNGMLIITRGNNKKVISPADIEQIILTTSGISISTKALRTIMRYGIDLVILDSKGLPSARLYLPYITRTTDSRRLQYVAYTKGNVATKYAKSFAESKILNQALYIKYLGKLHGLNDLISESNEILSLLNKLSKVSGDISSTRKVIMNIEAKAARRYWGSLAILLPKDIKFDGRDPDASDEFNKCLNYLYGVLYSDIFKALCLAGLDPYAGFLHVDRSGKPVLTFDFIEMFRVSAVDSLLIDVFRSGFRAKIVNGVLDPHSRGELISRYSNWMRRVVRVVNGRSNELRNHIRSYAYRLASSLRNRKVFKGFVERWWI